MEGEHVLGRQVIARPVEASPLPAHDRDPTGGGGVPRRGDARRLESHRGPLILNLTT